MHLERDVIVRVRDGLHARPATQFVKLAKSFASSVEIVRDGKNADAKSSVRLMLLGVKEGDPIVLRADGVDAAQAIDALAAFVGSADAGLTAEQGGAAARKADAPAADASAPAAKPDVRKGIGASEGVAIGAAFAFFPHLDTAPVARRLSPDEIGPEYARFEACLESVIADLRSGRGDPGDAGIVEALIDLAQDESVLCAIKDRIHAGEDAASATLAAGVDLARAFEAVADPYIQARAEDLRGVTRTIATALTGGKGPTLADLPEGAIIVADEISAWDLARAPVHRIGGILCISGGATSHVAIMARTHAIPAVLGFQAPPDLLRGAAHVAIDGTTGDVVLDPDAGTSDFYAKRRAEQQAERDALSVFADVEPITRDGRLIEVAANLGSLVEIDVARKAGAMGVGLFRTELLFMERAALPDEEEQTAVYSELAAAFAPYPVIIRTLDVGGDKPVAGVEFPHEENPFLGWRGIRMCLDRPEIFKPQLRALLRAAPSGTIKVMVPMITHKGELRAVRALMDECARELKAEGVPYADVPLGVMMETPAAAFLAEDLATEAAFFSIGTNDLTQYVMAADRLNPRLADLNRVEHPAVMKAIEMIARAGQAAGIMVGVCGEAAGRPDLIPDFVRFGITELSMSPASIARAKQCIVGI